ncbi:MAG: sigma-70 family RNA polymerase sigma factor [Kofleriaceae bacterium]|nr:MAG: sigma-70 family RNA polymerase sigma factor [Kofleriaceae bacterium]MBZ0237237.1 RNA polymerase factor sigma-32 [Kofleriaceae bacterium]
MARAKAPSRGRKRKAGDDDVIDVGEAPVRDGDGAAANEDRDEDAETDGEEPVEDLVSAAASVIDVGDEEAEADGGDAVAAVEEADYGREGRVGLIKRDPMQAYMQEVRRYPLLTPEEEHALAVRLLEHGDSNAARRLVEANLRLVVKIAYEYRRAHKNLLDLVQEGNIGLMQAVRKFDPYRGVKLSSYGAFWIRAYILKFILNNWRLVKIGTTQAQRKLFFNLRKERERLEQLGFQPTSALLAENLQVSEKEVVEMEKRLAAPEASLDAPMPGDEDGGRSRIEFVPSDDVRPDQAVADNQFATLFNEKLDAFEATLEGRELTIFRDRWRTDPPKTLQEIGDHYGVSRERARQLEKRVLDRLRKYLRSELGTDVDIDASRD